MTDLYPSRPCQRCGEIIDRFYSARFCEKCGGSRKKDLYGDNDPQGAAWKLTEYAIKIGFLPRITKETKCADCDDIATLYDHRDYSKPLDVDPVCRGCNSKRGVSIGYTGEYGRKK